MPVYDVTVSDTLTIRRTATISVIASSSDAAEERALDLADNSPLIRWSEEQVDATAYEVEEVELSTALSDILE